MDKKISISIYKKDIKNFYLEKAVPPKAVLPKTASLNEVSLKLCFTESLSCGEIFDEIIFDD